MRLDEVGSPALGAVAEFHDLLGGHDFCALLVGCGSVHGAWAGAGAHAHSSSSRPLDILLSCGCLWQWRCLH
jgi:hypothetical protein